MANRMFPGNSLMDYLISLAIFLLSVLTLYLVRSVVIKKARMLAERTSTTVDDFLVLSNDYLHYMNVRHAVNVDIVERFRKEGIEFAFPTQTIELQGGLAAGNQSG
ncbi:MAG: hypothetical protein ACQERI_03800 [Candidatus Krumholzibacteriota bacterium]